MSLPTKRGTVEPRVGGRQEPERDHAADQRAAVGRRRDRDLARQDDRAGDDQQAVDPEGRVLRLDEVELLAEPGLLDRPARARTSTAGPTVRRSIAAVRRTWVVAVVVAVIALLGLELGSANPTFICPPDGGAGRRPQGHLGQ